MAIGANMTQREQAFVGAGFLALAAAAAFWYFAFTPKQAATAALAAHVDSVEAGNRQARVDLARGTAQHLQREADAYQRNLSAMRELVPTSNEVPALLEEVSTAARRVGLDIGAVEPQPVVRGDLFDTYRYKVTVIGGYHPIAAFLANVGSLDRIIAPVGLTLKPSTAAPTAPPGARPAPADRASLQADFQIQTYVARTAPGALRGGGE